MKQPKQYVTKYTVFNVLANILMITYLVGTAANFVLVKLNVLKDFYVRFAPVDYLESKVFAGFAMPSSLIAIGVCLVAVLLIVLPMFWAKHGKGWNLIPFVIILADTVYFAKKVYDGWVEQEGFDLAHVFGRSFLKNVQDINLFIHVIVLLFIAFAIVRGTKRIQVVAETAPEVGYRNVSLKRKIAPFGRNQEFECWLNGENLATIADGQEKNFLVDQYGAELVVVAQSGEESNIVTIPEGKGNASYVINTSRAQSGNLVLTIQEA